jgi:hypothetical protein
VVSAHLAVNRGTTGWQLFWMTSAELFCMALGGSLDGVLAERIGRRQGLLADARRSGTAGRPLRRAAQEVVTTRAGVPSRRPVRAGAWLACIDVQRIATVRFIPHT